MRTTAVGAALALLLATACGDDGGGDSSGDSDAGESDGGGGGADAAAGGVGLIVHVGYLVEGSTTWVVLGDGAEYQKLETTTDAVFPDVRLPQDVHHVQASLDGNLTVRSYLAIDAHEIWLEGAGSFTESYDRQLSGTVTSDLEAGTWVAAGGGTAGLYGVASAGVGGGGYDIYLHGDALGTVDVVAYQAFSGQAVRAGAVRGVDLTGEAPVTGVDIEVDHPFDEQLAVTVTDDEPYGGAYKAQLIFTLSGFVAFWTEGEDLPIRVPTPVMDTAMQAVDRYVWVPLGLGDGYDFGPLETARMYVKVAPEAGAVTVDALAPFQLHQPAFGLEEDPTIVAAGSLDAITWTADPEAVQVELRVQATGDPNAYEELCWEIYAPAGLGRAAVPDLPDEVFAGAFLAPRRYALYMTQQELAGIDEAIDLYTDPAARAVPGYRNTRRLSFFTVE
ncbi:MAG TPA: hypothetical protein VFU21_04625 [Kofleriaceae bacterium]|nr:hypothetical protein [Kofleriaceae bacterium]